MSLQPADSRHVPEETQRVAQARASFLTFIKTESPQK